LKSNELACVIAPLFTYLPYIFIPFMLFTCAVYHVYIDVEFDPYLGDNIIEPTFAPSGIFNDANETVIAPLVPVVEQYPVVIFIIEAVYPFNVILFTLLFS